MAAVLIVGTGAAWWFWPREAVLDLVRTADQNVLVVTIDTLRADAVGCSGGTAATPNLERLAADGIRYDFAHAHSVMTLPSHVSILTGLYPFQHGVRDNAGYRVSAATTTLATRLAAKGFASAAFIGAFPLDSQFGLDAGFDPYDDRLSEVKAPADFAFSERPAGAVVQSALSWLRGQNGKWCAWVHVYDPHAPAKPPEPFATQYASNPYAGEVAYTDSALGELFDYVRGLKARPTLVVVTSDHGEGLGDHGEPTHGVFAYESTLRIPLIVAQYSNGVPAPGPAPSKPRVSEAAVQHVDLLPTILDALALDRPADLLGQSLLGLTADGAARRASYFEALTPSLNRGWAPLHGVLVDREKYIDLPLPEMYDLGPDPSEAANLANRARNRVRLLETRLKAFGPTAPGERRAESTEVTDRLRALGYTSGSAARRKVYTEEDDPKRLIDLDRDMHRAVELFHERRLRDAAGIYQGIAARRPDMAIAYLHLSFLQWEMGDPLAAIETLRSARSRIESDTEIDWRLGMYLSETGRFDEALPLLEQAATRTDAGVDAQNALGITYARMKRTDDALRTFARILDIDGNNAMAHQNIGSTMLAVGDLDRAAEAFRNALAVNPDWAAAHAGLGVVYSRRGDLAAAVDAWTRAVRLNPSDFDALFNLATELINLGKTAAAKPLVEQFVASAPRTYYGRDIARLEAWLARAPARR